MTGVWIWVHVWVLPQKSQDLPRGELHDLPSRILKRTSLVGDLDPLGGERIAVLYDRIVGVLILWPDIQDLLNWRSLFAFSKFCKERLASRESFERLVDLDY